MKRREALQTVIGGMLAGPVAAAVASAAPTTAHGYGQLTVEGHRAHLRTTGEFLVTSLDGVDVTRYCYFADDRAGVVEMFCPDREHHRDWTQKGARHVAGDGAGACRMRLTGHVVIQPGVNPHTRA